MMIWLLIHAFVFDKYFEQIQKYTNVNGLAY